MQKRISLLCCLLVIVAASQNLAAKPARNWPVYSGPWFDIRYPPGFKVRPSQRTWATAEGKYDSVFFTAPDESVEFYVLSPQWNREPKEIMLDPRREILVSHRVERKQRGRDSRGEYIHRIVTQWFTVRAKDGSYWRSWLDIEDTGIGTRKVFGIKYRNKKAYDRYKDAYQRFKNSLVQYAD